MAKKQGKRHPFPALPDVRDYQRDTNDRGHGAEFAPTAQAIEAEAERHNEEEARGHFAAGVDGRTHAVDLATDALDEDDAAIEANADDE